jgi:nitroreductase
MWTMEAQIVTKLAKPQYPIHGLIAARWSPYGFSDRAVSTDDLCALFEAARWAPSSYNEQPWRYIVADQADAEEFKRVLGCLWELNQAWAQYAPVLALGVAATHFARNGKDNAAALHDLGLAAANLCLEATARGLMVHQMIGIDPEKARSTFNIPEGFQPLTALAIGYQGWPAGLKEEILARDDAPRERRPITELVFSGTWGKSSWLIR